MKFGDVGARIKEKRKEKKLTQAQLAYAIGKTESSIRKYEKNLVEIPDSVMHQIALALDTTESYLCGIDKMKFEFKCIDAFETLLKMNGYDVHYDGPPDTDDLDTDYNVILEKDGKYYYIKPNDYKIFEQEIHSYVKFKIQELIDKK